MLVPVITTKVTRPMHVSCTPHDMRTCVPNARIKCRDKWFYLADTVECNVHPAVSVEYNYRYRSRYQKEAQGQVINDYISLSLIPASNTQVLIYDIQFISICVLSVRQTSRSSNSSSGPPIKALFKHLLIIYVLLMAWCPIYHKQPSCGPSFPEYVGLNIQSLNIAGISYASFMT